MSSSPKVNIPLSTYEKIKKLPTSQQKTSLLKEVAKAAKAAGYTKADLLKDTTNINFKISTRFKTIEKSSSKSNVVKDMAKDVKTQKENELIEKEKEENKLEQTKQNNKKNSPENDSSNKNNKTLKITVSEYLINKVAELGVEEAKNVIRSSIQMQAQEQDFDWDKLNQPCGGLSINDADKNQGATATTPNGSTLLDSLVEVVYANCKGKNVEEQARACEDNDSKNMNDIERAIGKMVGPTAEQEVELSRYGLEPAELAPNAMAPRRP